MPRRNSPKSDSSDDEEEMRAFAAQFEPQRLAVAAAIIKGGGRGASPERPAPPTPVRPVLRGLPMKVSKHAFNQCPRSFGSSFAFIVLCAGYLFCMMRCDLSSVLMLDKHRQAPRSPLPPTRP